MLVATLASLFVLSACAPAPRTLPPVPAPVEPTVEVEPEDAADAIAAAESNLNDVARIRQALDVLLLDPVLGEDPDWLNRGELLWTMLPQGDAHDRARGALLAARRGRENDALERLGESLAAWQPLERVGTESPTSERFAREAQALIAEARRDPWSLLLARVALDEHLLTDPALQADHHRSLWRAMAALPIVVMQDPALRTEALEARARVDLPRLTTAQRRDLDGWLDLFAASSRLGADETLAVAIREWSGRHPVHPANGWLPELIAAEQRIERAAGESPRIALMVPLSGSLGALGAAIAEGALAAANARQPALAIDVVDTRSEAAEAARLYRNLRDRVDVIVGPLEPESVAAVLREREAGDAPLITLNRPAGDETGLSTKPGVSVLALSPEVDGVAAAEHALANGHAAALIAIVEDRVGPRAADAFTRHFEQGGGRVVDRQTLEAGGRGSQAAIAALLRTDDTAARRSALSRATGLGLESDPQPRGDVDLLFIPGNTGPVALVAPFLHFQRAQGLLWLGTQHLVDPAEGRASQDLSGFRYPEAPWVIDTLVGRTDGSSERFTPAARESARLRERLAAESSAQDSNQRLARFFALGIDAVRIAAQPQSSVETHPSRVIRGALGDWRLDPLTRSWQRAPQWVDLAAGRLVPVGAEGAAIQTLPIIEAGDESGDGEADGDSAATDGAAS